jgi:adenylosuccinate lyase
MSALLAISPIDGRYYDKTKEISEYFSEFALIKYRVHVEIEYLIKLVQLDEVDAISFSADQVADLRKVVFKFDLSDAEKIKSTEKITNHDVKAVEYFVKDQLDRLGLSDYKEYVHLGLTSQDINNTAIPYSILLACKEVYLPLLNRLIDKIDQLTKDWKSISMLARTHGQPASPTRLGKEFKVFQERLDQQLQALRNLPIPAKFGGANGNFNAHQVAFPNVDWQKFGQSFVEDQLGLYYSFPTTQIEHYDHLAAFFDNLKRINTIIIDFNRDCWQYISMGYFKQKISKNEVGSSAMPHKVNPIDFENSEGNLGMANAVLEHLSAKLPISRLQRDLTDSTVLRNVGTPFGHILISLQSTLKGLDKLELNQSKIDQDLEENWAVLAEPIQTILRREKYPNPYETLKDLTRTNDKIDQQKIHDFIDHLNIKSSVKKELKSLTPHNYTGI